MSTVDPFAYTADLHRSANTMVGVKRGISELIKRHKSDGADLLEVGLHHGLQTLGYHAQFRRPARLEGYDWSDNLDPSVRGKIIFSKVNVEYQRFPAPDASFDVVVCNQVLEHLKNIYTPLSEMWRVLRPGGVLVPVCRTYRAGTTAHCWRWDASRRQRKSTNHMCADLRSGACRDT